MAHKGKGRSGPYGSYKTDTREKILEAAIAEFARAGYCGTRTKDIAAIAEIMESTLFGYFKSKDELFDAAVRAAIAAVKPRAAEIEYILDLDKSEKGIRLAALEFCNMMTVEFVRLYAFTILEHPGPLRLSLDGCVDAFSQQFERVFPRSAVQHLVDYCFGARIFRNQSSSKKAYRAAVDSFVQILLSGVGKPVPKARQTR